MPEIRFDDRIARTYDADSADRFAPEVLGPTVDLLAELADGRPALELAIGTGRVAVPLRQRGVEVHGIDVSPAMIERLRAKPGGAAIPVTIGDMATTRVPGRFGLVYLVFNTINNLTTQDEQVACFLTAADHLEPGGCFLIEVVVPELRRLPPGDTARVFALSPSYVAVEEFTDFTEAQIAWSHHYRAVDGRFEVFSAPYRHVWPSELDLMARLAGLTRRSRWADWDRSPFTGESRSHVSVWTKPA
ncbi:MAG TPA: class I SAM-dependent methyltransferase [Iamia sp.]|nr:class I SAM-dependent methyltransferase [Iamia sp.]